MNVTSPGSRASSVRTAKGSLAEQKKIDWNAVEYRGEPGTSHWKTVEAGDLRQFVWTFSSGFIADRGQLDLRKLEKQGAIENGNRSLKAEGRTPLAVLHPAATCSKLKGQLPKHQCGLP